MRIYAEIYVLAKLKKPWTDEKGVEHLAYSTNIMQENGEIIDTLRLSQSQHDSIEPNKNYTVTVGYGKGQNGGYLKLLTIVPKK